MDSISVLQMGLFQENNTSSGFYFNTMKGHLKSSHKHIEKPHRHDFYVTVLFTQGSGVHEIDFQSYDVQAGSLFFCHLVRYTAGSFLMIQMVISSFFHKNITICIM